MPVPQGDRLPWGGPAAGGSPTASPANGHLSATAHLPEGTRSETTFDLAVQLHAPLPVSAVASHTHKLEAQGLGTERVTLALADEDLRDNRDFVLEYKLGGERTATGLMLYRAPDGSDENFFLALVACITPRFDFHRLAHPKVTQANLL